MPQVTKEALSQYVRTGCPRQLRLNLHPDNRRYQPERAAEGMPPPQPPRPGLEHVKQAGDAWQAAKLDDLARTFGSAAVLGTAAAQPLETLLAQATPHRFLAEAEFAVGTAFLQALGIADLVERLRLDFARLRPDLIELLPPGTFPGEATAAGDVVPIPAADGRAQLRVIDIKLTAKASLSYFAEVTLYTMALAGWLRDRGLADRFVVVPDAAVWPGSHDAAHLTRFCDQARREGQQPSAAELRATLAVDLEPAPFEVFALRVRRFLQVEVPEVLARPWRDLDWHVDNRCATCEYLGEQRATAPPHDDHCLPTAGRSDHLSRVAFLTRGARLSLEGLGVRQVAALADRAADDAAYDGHQVLRATRAVLAGRAGALRTGLAGIPPDSGTSAVLPRWADLHVYLTADFDLGSAITVAFGLEAGWLEPRPYGAAEAGERAKKSWRHPPQLVIDRKLEAEQKELLAFLKRIHDILKWVQDEDEKRAGRLGLTGPQKLSNRSRVQFYLWDALHFQHLTRVVGRHLQAILADRDLNYLAWLFPPEELLPNPELATRRSPITLVREVVRSVLAAPVGHYYSLFAVARVYHDEGLQATAFNVHPLFAPALGDQIPSERAHEIWTRATDPRHWSEVQATYQETVRKQLMALQTVVRRLEKDLGPRLSQAAPVIHLGPPAKQSRVSTDGQLWHAFAKLNNALAELEVHQIRAMPPHEREARFRSARLQRRLFAAEAAAALAALNLVARPGRRVYELGPGSREVKFREGDFACALAPESLAGFLDRKLAAVIQNTPLATRYSGDQGWQTLMEDACNVTVAGLDRHRGLIAVDPTGRFPTMLDELEGAGIARFDQGVILDPVHHDFFTRKLLAALQAIGNPKIASRDPLVQRAIGQTGRGANPAAASPVAELLWNAPAVAAAAVARPLEEVKAELIAHGLGLNPTQWRAWEDALAHRLRLIWGPPGTGKSRTVRALMVGAVLAARRADKPLRLLLTASTYTAIDNVLLDVARDLAALAPDCPVVRVRSCHQPAPAAHGPARDLALNRREPSRGILELRQQLLRKAGPVVVGAPPEQVHNLLVCEGGEAREELFDLIVIDEASQLDVAHAVLPLCALAAGGGVVLAGDPKQLPPIHQAEPPAGLESLVGSVYTFFRERHGVPETMLAVNYRSNAAIVGFARHAGYQPGLTSHSPGMRLDLLTPLPTERPADWPGALPWSPGYADLLDPERPAACFVYPEGRSSQWNRFEADAVAALLWLLHGRLASQLRGERHPGTGAELPAATAPYDVAGFWGRAVGVVTPHRAQQGLIVGRLQQAFPAHPAAALRDAVDTVERFQGQQRDVMIASFALGDPDAIRDEAEFLLSLNRFNVMASRARAKLVVLVSREVVDHLADELAVLRASRLLKVFVESFCGQSRPLDLGGVGGELRWA